MISRQEVHSPVDCQERPSSAEEDHTEAKRSAGRRPGGDEEKEDPGDLLGRGTVEASGAEVEELRGSDTAGHAGIADEPSSSSIPAFLPHFRRSPSGRWPLVKKTTTRKTIRIMASARVPQARPLTEFDLNELFVFCSHHLRVSYGDVSFLMFLSLPMSLAMLF